MAATLRNRYPPECPCEAEMTIDAMARDHRRHTLEDQINDALPNLATRDAAELARIVLDLVEVLRPEAIYAFGSQARGDATGESDFDLVVVVPGSNEPGYRRDQAALRAIGLHRVPLDVLVLTREEFEQHPDTQSSLPATIRREGRTLYAAA
jgi:hypothetical protein